MRADTNGCSVAEVPQPLGDTLQQIEAEIPRLRRYARYLGYEPDDADDLVCTQFILLPGHKIIINHRPHPKYNN
jgi:hypothetical protein